MCQVKKTFVLTLLIFFTFSVDARSIDYLSQCWKKQVKPLKSQYLQLNYSEQTSEFYHSMERWQQLNSSAKGLVWINAKNFLKRDTLTTRSKRTYYSKTQLSKDELLFLDHGEKELSAVTKSQFLEQTYKTAVYSPVRLISFFYEEKIPADEERSNSEVTVYKTTINKAIVSLFIRNTDQLLEKVAVLSSDDLYGDILSTYNYNDYINIEKLFYPRSILIEKNNGLLKDEVKISVAAVVKTVTKLLDRPATYMQKIDSIVKPEIRIQKHNEHIHFIDLVHENTRVLLVEFKDFLLVAEAPLSSTNGELIIREARKLAPGKSIKYFAFGHGHPHYLGGMRAFVHKGATVLGRKSDEEYLKYLVKAPHSLNPDSLELQPKSLKFQELNDSTIISDGSYSMEVYFIGKKSAHTDDYLVYYFPNEKLLFEDDLVWIEKSGESKKPGATQAGLYNALYELGLKVETIVQSWGITSEKYKTVIPFGDLDKARELE